MPVTTDGEAYREHLTLPVSAHVRLDALPLARIVVAGPKLTYRHQAPFRLRFGVVMRTWTLLGGLLVVLPLLAWMSQRPHTHTPWGLLLGFIVILPLAPRIVHSFTSVEATVDRDAGTLTLCHNRLGLGRTTVILLEAITGLETRRLGAPPRSTNWQLYGIILVFNLLYMLEPSATLSVVTADGIRHTVFECMVRNASDQLQVGGRVVAELSSFLGVEAAGS